MQFTVPRLQVEVTVYHVQIVTEMCNEPVSWATELGDASARVRSQIMCICNQTRCISDLYTSF